MFVRYWFIYLCLHLIDKVSLQNSVPVNGVVGGSVILPCLYEGKLETEEINVFWRYKQETKVYDIENGNPLTNKQDAMFKGRIQSLSSDYANGNFSLILSNLTLADEGQFSCSIPKKYMKYELTLLVRAMPTTVSTPKSTVNTRSSSMRVQPEGILTFLLLFCILHCIRVIC